MSKNPVGKKMAKGDLMSLDHVRGRLALLWLISAGLIFITLILQSLRLVLR